MAEILKDTHDEEWLRAKVLSPEYGDGFSLVIGMQNSHG
jgi:hypothetical protein